MRQTNRVGLATADFSRQIRNRIARKKNETARARPRLLYVINSFASGGAEFGLLTLVQQGFFDGFDLRIVALAAGQGPIYGELVALLGADKITCLNNTITVPDTQLPVFIPRLIQILWDSRPDISVVSLPQAVICLRLAALFFPRMKVVTFEHNITSGRRIAEILLFATSRLTDLVFADADQTLRVRQALYRRPKPSAEVPLTFLAASAPRPWRKPDRFQVLSFGRLAPQKNYAELLKGFAAILRNYDAELTIAGDGDLRGELEHLARTLGVERKVHFLGFVPNAADLLAGAHVYIQPSLREGLAISVLQAMATGMIVVASDIGAIADYGVDGRNMIKIAMPPVADAIATALQRAFDTYAESEPMALMAQQTVRESYSESVVRQKWAIAREALWRLTQCAN